MPSRSSQWIAGLACCLGLSLPAAAAEPQSPPTPRTAADCIERAFRRVDTWQWPEALADANEALRLDPASARALLARGAAGVGVNPAAAVRDLAEAEKRGERSARLCCEQGFAYCALKRYDMASEAAERALKLDPKDARAYALRARATTVLEGLSAALADLDRAVALSPSSAVGPGLRAEITMEWDVNLGPPPAEFLQLKRLNPNCPAAALPAIMAMRFLLAAIRLDPDNPRYHLDRGYAFLQLGHGDDALHDLDRAVALNPGFFRAYYWRMHARVAQGDYQGADKDAVRMIEIDPADYVGHHAHGFYLVMIGQEAQGIKEIDLAIQLDPEHAVKDYLVRARTRARQNRPSEVVADAGKALEINPSNVDAHYLRGRAFLQLQEWNAAIAAFDVLVRVAPQVIEHRTWRAEAKMRRGDYRGAVADYDQVLKMSPNFAVASYQRGLCRGQLGDCAGAAADFRDALAHGIERETFQGNCPGHAAAHRGLGDALLKQHKAKDACAEYDLALTLYPRDPYSFLQRGYAKRELHDDHGAILDFIESITLDPAGSAAFVGAGFVKYDVGAYRGALADFDNALLHAKGVAEAFAGRGLAKVAIDHCEEGLADLHTALRQVHSRGRGELEIDPAAPPDAAVGEETPVAAATGNPFAYLLGQEVELPPPPPAPPPLSLLSQIHHGRGQAYYKMAQYRQAIREYDYAFRIQPPTEHGLVTRAHAKWQLGDRAGFAADLRQALALNPKGLLAGCNRAMFAALEGDYAVALDALHPLVESPPGPCVPRLHRGLLLDVLHEPELALADYREVAKDRRVGAWNMDQAALAIWTIRARRGERIAADEELRQHVQDRRPDADNNWYVRLAAFLLDRADSEAAVTREAQAADRARVPWHQAAAYYYVAVRRSLGGDKAGASEMLNKAAATNAVTELQWYESALRLAIASGKIPAPQQAGAGPWRDHLPTPPKRP